MSLAIESPVVYVDAKTVQDLKTGTDPVTTLANAFAVAGQITAVPQYSNNPLAPGMIQGKPNGFRTFGVIVNATDGAIEGVEAADIHGYWIGQPVVPDANGNPTRKPSAVAAQAGGTGTDWIDAPGSGQGAIGLWVFEQPHAIFHGVSFVLKVTLTNESTDLMMTLIVDPNQTIDGVGADLYPQNGPNPPSTSDYYSDHDGKPTVPAPLVQKNLTVTIRQTGMFLFAIVEST